MIFWKSCKKCGSEKSEKSFYRNKGKLRYLKICIACDKERKRVNAWLRYQRNPKKYRLISKKRRKNPEYLNKKRILDKLSYYRNKYQISNRRREKRILDALQKNKKM